MRVVIQVRDRQGDHLAEKLPAQAVDHPLGKTGGEKALQEQRLPLCRELLQEALETEGLYITRPLRQRCRVLLTLAETETGEGR